MVLSKHELYLKMIWNNHADGEKYANPLGLMGSLVSDKHHGSMGPLGQKPWSGDDKARTTFMINPYSMYLNNRFVDEMLHSFTLCSSSSILCCSRFVRGRVWPGTPPLFAGELRINLALTGQCFWAVISIPSLPFGVQEVISDLIVQALQSGKCNKCSVPCFSGHVQ